jgi:hypothetical protein
MQDQAGQRRMPHLGMSHSSKACRHWHTGFSAMLHTPLFTPIWTSRFITACDATCGGDARTVLLTYSNTRLGVLDSGSRTTSSRRMMFGPSARFCKIFISRLIFFFLTGLSILMIQRWSLEMHTPCEEDAESSRQAFAQAEHVCSGCSCAGARDAAVYRPQKI